MTLDILPFINPICGDPTVVGPKAAVLAQLRQRLGDRVPNGFVLTPDVAAAIAEADGAAAREAALYLQTRTDELLDPSAIGCAVRSSALDEDTPDRSFAGQYETVLGVSGGDALLDAVRRCVASVTSARIDAYRKASQVEAGGRIAVVIQEMVSAERSGVVFTANPITGADEIIINASYGLGDLLVSGEITPDQLVLDADDRIVTSRVGSKRMMAINTPTGVRRLTVPEALREVAAITEDQARAVATSARCCAEQLGFPVDVEWAITGAHVRVLQARPITGQNQKASV